MSGFSVQALKIAQNLAASPMPKLEPYDVPLQQFFVQVTPNRTSNLERSSFVSVVRYTCG